MKENFDHKKIEEKAIIAWKKNNIFSPKIEKGKKPFSIFLNPPNASGPLHVGNALIVAIQDILARYHRAIGDSTLWAPSTDHGGYETQVNFERETEKNSNDKSAHTDKELFLKIEKFVENNNAVIKSQLEAMGASVDWSRFRYTMDEKSLLFVDQMFKKMVADNLIYRQLYMVSYCPLCATFLADIELKKHETKMPLYHVKFRIINEDENIVLTTMRPEFIFSVTHVLVHPNDKVNAKYIGKTLINPITSQPIKIIASKRKWNAKDDKPFLSPFSPSFDKYDYGYALRYSLPYHNLLDWNGKMIERYPGLIPLEAREKEVEFLKKNNCIKTVDDSNIGTTLLCKKGHITENLIVFTWFLRLDDEKNPLRKPAIKATEQKNFIVMPQWRKNGLTEWMSKMNDWPIARQNVWGIKIPIWYDVSQPEHYMVWFIDKNRTRQHGNLKDILDKGFLLEEIYNGLERIYAGKNAIWSLEKPKDKPCLPETDTFDTWFSSGQWATVVFGEPGSPDFSYFYPGDAIVTGHDLLMLSVSREIMLSLYLTKILPYRMVYLHPLLRGKDGQKMSKSVGNVTSLEYYLEKFGADITRMALISYLVNQEDFYFAEERLDFFQEFSKRLWKLSKFIDSVQSYRLNNIKDLALSIEDENILKQIDKLFELTGNSINRYSFQVAQERVCNFLDLLEKYAKTMQSEGDIETSISLLCDMFEKYLIVLHPFMPFMTEELYGKLGNKNLLATAKWPRFK